LCSYDVTSSFLNTNPLKADLTYTEAGAFLCSCAVMSLFLSTNTLKAVLT